MQSRRRIASTTIALVALIGMSASAEAGAAASPPKVSGHPLTPVISEGEKLEVELTGRNAGKGKTAKTKVGLLLSTNKRESKKDLPLKGKAKIPTLGKGKSKTIDKSFGLPRKAKPDGYYVLACPGKAKCKALKGTVGIGPKVERVNVELQTDDSRQVSQLVTRAGGGRLETTGADGTRYVLILPPGSVPADVTVTMTPVAAAQGLPFDGLAGGVRLGPLGLSLDEPAKLLLQRDGLSISPGTAAFGSSDDKDLFLTPWTTPPDGESLGAGTMAVGVTHFSGWGVVSLSQTQLGAQYTRSAFQARDRIAQDVRQAIEDSGTGVLDEAKLAQIAEDYTEQVVKPLLGAAVQDPVFLDDAVAAYIGLERQLQLLGKAEGFPDDPAVANLFKRAFMRYVQVLRARCAQADFTTITEAVALARQMNLLAGMLPGINGPPQSLSEALELLDQCLRFELRMTSSQVFQDEFTFTATLVGTVPLRFQGDELVGEGPIDYTAATYESPGDDCTESVVRTESSTMKAEGSADLLQLSPADPGKPPVVSPFVSFAVDPGTPAEVIRVQCPDEPTVEGPINVWLSLWAGCEHPDPTESRGFIRTIDGFTATGTPGVLAERTYEGSFPCPGDLAPVQAQERWEFVHTPETG